MRVRFWGVRGSIAVAGPGTVRYGGNTPCVEIQAGGELIVVDAGTGIRPLAVDLHKRAAGSPITGSLFIGHTHWDHIQGFPFFTPLYVPTTRFKVYGVHGATLSLQDALAGQMKSTYFPVSLQEMASHPEFVELREPVMVGPVKVSYHYLNHPGVTVGYRFEFGGKVVSYLSDHEPYSKLNAQGEFSAKEDAAIARFAQGSDLLIAESQYTEDEYKLKKGWGHSTFGDVLDLARMSGAKRLALFHHDPYRDDDGMDKVVAECLSLASSQKLALDCFAAREGMVLDL